MSDAQKVVEGVQKLEEARKDCIAALAEKEVTAPENMKWSELAEYINQIGA